MKRLVAALATVLPVAVSIPLLVGCAPTNRCVTANFHTNIHNSADGIGMVHVATNQNICVNPDGFVTSNSGGTNTAIYGAYAPVANAHPLSDGGYTGPTNTIPGWETKISVRTTVQVNIDLKFLGIVISTQTGHCDITFVAIVRTGGTTYSDVYPTNIQSGSCTGGLKVSAAT